MRSFKRASAAAVAALLTASLSASAHHSFAGQFDRSQPVAFEGIVTRVEWQNPQVFELIIAREHKPQ